MRAVLIAICLGILTAIGLYQAQVKGVIPFNNKPEVQTQTKENRIVVNEESAIISVVEKASPSVVAIGVSRRVVNPHDPFSLPRQEDETIGTGFVVSKDGVIVTNRHVVDDSAGRYTVITKDGEKYDVKKVYKDAILDLAIVKIEASNLVPLEFGDTTQLKVGQTVIAIGNALGKFTNTVTTGVVSGLGRKVVAGNYFSGSAESLDNLIQTDAAINPGNSGGPLLNTSGQVIGVNVATSATAQNIGFALPANLIKPIVTEFLEKGSVSRPYLGIRYRFVTRDLAIYNSIPQGTYIQEVLTDGPADKAGVRAGDIIIRINGQSVDSESKISEVVSKSTVGSRLELTIWRDGVEVTKTAILQESVAQ